MTGPGGKYCLMPHRDIGLTLSRSIGDRPFKEFGDAIVATPDVVTMPLSADDEFIVLGCDGGFFFFFFFLLRAMHAASPIYLSIYLSIYPVCAVGFVLASAVSHPTRTRSSPTQVSFVVDVTFAVFVWAGTGLWDYFPDDDVVQFIHSKLDEVRHAHARPHARARTHARTHARTLW